jgi:hypothetical protein
MESIRTVMKIPWSRSLAAVTLVGLLAAACTAGGSTASSSASTSPGPTPSSPPSPSQGGTLAQAQLKLRLLEQLGQLWYCDPDFYPVARVDEQKAADDRLPEIQRDMPLFQAILAHLGIPPGAALSAAQRLAVYRTWKQINAIQLTAAGDAFGFNILVRADSAREEGQRVIGTIDARGVIHIERQTTEGPPPCPICLARGTRIATPDGQVPVEDLRVGDQVWTLGVGDQRTLGVIEKVGSAPVPRTHEVVHLVLVDGREAWVSPGHPLPDGRTLGQLRPGDPVDGSLVAAADLVPYQGRATFDLLPSGSTGTYWANGILLRSTLLP